MPLSLLFTNFGNGKVSKFDASGGLGVIISEDGNEITFHCIVISDNSRTIDVGAPVAFTLMPSLGGKVEASVVQKL